MENRLKNAMIRNLFLAAVLFSSGTHAQLKASNEDPLIYGHHHIAVSDVDEHLNFWVNTLGGTQVTFGDFVVVKFTNTLLFISDNAPSGGTKGTIVNHIGFTVPDLRGLLEKVESDGYRIVTAAEVPASYSVDRGIATNPEYGNQIAFVMSPDEVKIELTYAPDQEAAMQSHHVHFMTPDIEAMRNWYVDTLGAEPTTRDAFQSADVPGINLTFSGTSESVVGTEGRSLDHIGFEVEGLEAFCKDLEARGIIFDMPYTRLDDLGIAIAFLTDPYGTSIELVEGLDEL